MGCRNTNELLSETSTNSKHIIHKVTRIHDINCPQLTASEILSLRQVSFDNGCPSFESVQGKSTHSIPYKRHRLAILLSNSKCYQILEAAIHSSVDISKYRIVKTIPVDFDRNDK